MRGTCQPRDRTVGAVGEDAPDGGLRPVQMLRERHLFALRGHCCLGRSDPSADHLLCHLDDRRSDRRMCQLVRRDDGAGQPVHRDARNLRRHSRSDPDLDRPRSVRCHFQPVQGAGGGEDRGFPCSGVLLILPIIAGGTSLAGGRGAIWRTAVGVAMLASLRDGSFLLDIDPPPGTS